MHLLLGAVGIAVPVFAATNADDLLVLIAFFSDGSFRRRHVVAGQFVGIKALILASLACTLAAFLIPAAYVGWLCLLPFGLGVKKLLESRKAGEAPTPEGSAPTPGIPRRSSGYMSILSVAAVTIANGGDNIGVYVPLFSTRPHLQVAIIIATFLVLTGIWCAVAHWLVHHESLGKYIRAYGNRLLPWVLMGFGVYILASSQALSLILRSHPR